MFSKVDEAELRADPSAMLDRVQSGCEAIVIKADGNIVAALVNANLFEQIRRMSERFDEVKAKIVGNLRDFPVDGEMGANYRWRTRECFRCRSLQVGQI